MKIKGKRIIISLAACAAIAISAMSLGIASWQTAITGSGSVTAHGKWDLAITDADMSISSVGAEAKLDYSEYSLQAKTLTATQYGNLCISASVPRESYSSSAVRGEQSKTIGLDKNQNCHLCLVDSTRIDITRFGHIPTNNDDGRAAMYRTLADKTDSNAAIIRLRDTNTAPDGQQIEPLKAWNYYKSKTDYFGDTSVQGKITEDLILKSDELVRKLRPDTYQNYVLVNFACDQVTDATKDQSGLQFIIAEMGSTDGTAPKSATYTDFTATFSDVSFALPGAWAEYNVTVTNRGTVDANLSGLDINLNTESEQLVLDKPDLSGEILKPGESCTVTCVVKIPSEVTGELNADGALSINLTYGQNNIEPAPAAGHSHG